MVEPILTAKVLQFAENMDLINPQFKFDIAGTQWRHLSDWKVKTADLLRRLGRPTSLLFLKKETLGKTIFYSAENVGGKIVVTDRSYSEQESNPDPDKALYFGEKEKLALSTIGGGGEDKGG